MRIEFNSSKDAINIHKHGLSLAEAQYLEWDTALEWLDTRFHYDEPRMSALVLKGSTLFYVAYTERDEALRIISLRPATKHEVRRYVSEN